MSDYKGAALMIDAFPKAKTLLGDKGYDTDWFRQALIERGITPCIPPKANRKFQIDYDSTAPQATRSLSSSTSFLFMFSPGPPLQRPAFLCRLLFPRIAGPSPAAAKSEGGKGAAS